MSLTSRRIVRRAPRIAVLVLLPFLLAGCFRVDLAITVNDDGSGTMSMLVAVDQSLLGLLDSQLGDSGGTDGDGSDEPTVDPLELFGDVDPSELPPGVTVEPYSEDDFTGARITFPFEATDDVAASINEAFASAAGGGPMGEGAPLEDFVLRQQDDGGWRFEARAASPAGEDGDLDASMARLLLDDATFTVRLRLPGEVAETNADEQNDGELVWHIDPTGDDRVLTAVTRPEGSGPNLLLLGGVAALVTTVVVLGVGYWVRRGPATPPAEGPSA